MMRQPCSNTTRWCECGNGKSPGAFACTRCIQLDGKTVAAFDVIQLLRDCPSGLTSDAMAEELSRYREAVDRTLANLMSKGRVKRRGLGKRGEPYVYRLAPVAP